MWVHNLDPVIFGLGPIEIRWYGLMYVIGFLFVWWFTARAARKGWLPLTSNQVENGMVWLAVGTVVGGRIGYCLFYEPLYFLQHPLEIVMFWKGGMSIHGGVLFVALFVWLWARKNKISFLQFTDVAIVPIALGQTLGRIGNFINGELWGRVTDVPWAMGFPLSGDVLPRHPSQIYEGIYDIIIGTILLVISLRMHKKGTSDNPAVRRDGFIFGLWLILYAIARSVIEFFREPDYYIGPLTAGQALSIPFFLVGAFFIWWSYKQRNREHSGTDREHSGSVTHVPSGEHPPHH